MDYAIKEEGDNITILFPHAKTLLENFCSPVFVDGAFPSDKKTIIHGSIVTSTNKIVCVGLVMCKSEDAKSVHMLLSQFTNGKEVVFITDEGKAMQKRIFTLEGNHRHMLCTWHLAKQLPRAIKLPNGSAIDEGTIRDILSDS